MGDIWITVHVRSADILFTNIWQSNLQLLIIKLYLDPDSGWQQQYLNHGSHCPNDWLRELQQSRQRCRWNLKAVTISDMLRRSTPSPAPNSPRGLPRPEPRKPQLLSATAALNATREKNSHNMICIAITIHSICSNHPIFSTWGQLAPMPENVWKCRSSWLVSYWVEFNVPLDMYDIGDKPIQATDCTGTDNLTHNNHWLDCLSKV